MTNTTASIEISITCFRPSERTLVNINEIFSSMEKIDSLKFSFFLNGLEGSKYETKVIELFKNSKLKNIFFDSSEQNLGVGLGVYKCTSKQIADYTMYLSDDDLINFSLIQKLTNNLSYYRPDIFHQILDDKYTIDQRQSSIIISNDSPDYERYLSEVAFRSGALPGFGFKQSICHEFLSINNFKKKIYPWILFTTSNLIYKVAIFNLDEQIKVSPGAKTEERFRDRVPRDIDYGYIERVSYSEKFNCTTKIFYEYYCFGWIRSVYQELYSVDRIAAKNLRFILGKSKWLLNKKINFRLAGLLHIIVCTSFTNIFKSIILYINKTLTLLRDSYNVLENIEHNNESTLREYKYILSNILRNRITRSANLSRIISNLDVKYLSCIGNGFNKLFNYNIINGIELAENDRVTHDLYKLINIATITKQTQLLWCDFKDNKILLDFAKQYVSASLESIPNNNNLIIQNCYFIFDRNDLETYSHSFHHDDVGIRFKCWHIIDSNGDIGLEILRNSEISGNLGLPCYIFSTNHRGDEINISKIPAKKWGSYFFNTDLLHRGYTSLCSYRLAFVVEIIDREKMISIENKGGACHSNLNVTNFFNA